MDIQELKAELERLHPASFGWALSCCRYNQTEAEDVLQMVYLKILQGRAVYRGESKLQTWLFAVIRNTAISERRKHLFRSFKPIGTTASTTASNPSSQPDVELERSEVQQRFHEALQCLPERQRETLHLVFYQDLSLREAAEVMGISIGSARQHYERGKKRMREVFDRKESDYGVRWGRKQNTGAVL